MELHLNQHQVVIYHFSDISGFTLESNNSGTASNYTLTGGTHTVDITATTPYITGTKVYDGSLTVSGTLLSFVDPSNLSASVSITGSGTASSKNVANGVTITQGNLGTLALVDQMQDPIISTQLH